MLVLSNALLPAIVLKHHIYFIIQEISFHLLTIQLICLLGDYIISRVTLGIRKFVVFFVISTIIEHQL